MHRRITILLFALVFVVADVWTVAVHADPFAATSTARKSIKRPGGVVTELNADSRDLVFQDFPFQDSNGNTKNEPRYLAFVTTDSTVDDNYPSPSGVCTGSTTEQVYWVDDYTGAVRCVSVNRSGQQGSADSYNPRMGGASGDEGRYVAFESIATNLFTPRTPGGSQQVIIHDRKGNRSWLSTSKCVPEGAPNDENPGSTEDVFLWGLSDDGKKALITSSGTNMADNLKPECGSTGVKGLFVRDGSDCKSPSFGDCKTDVLFDRYEFHASHVLLLDSDARNAFGSADSSTTVFDSQATVPASFNPDVAGFYDIYLHKNERFSVISRAQVPRCSLSSELLPILNDNDPANNDSIRPRVDGAGRYVVFESLATNLVTDTTNPNMVCKEPNGSGFTYYYPAPKETTYVSTGGFSQVYVYDAVTKKVEMVSIAHGSNAGGNGSSTNAWISRDAHYVVFESEATNLLSTTTTARRNIFMYDRIQKRMYLVTPGTGGNGLDADATISHVSNSGLVIAYQSRATDAVDPATNGGSNPGGTQHVYLAQNSCPTDTDLDGVPDCLDLCPTDLLKTEPGSCGCGKSETDGDKDLIPNCIDSCPTDPAKSAVGQCGCGKPDTDTDKDTVADCIDACPADNTKTAAGFCGCGVAETDGDGDGSPNCVDQCPSNPSKSVVSGCACGDLKSSPGVCGCNVSDADLNKNGIPDCLDPSASTQPSNPTVQITRVTPDTETARYQLVAKLQSVSGTVSYSVTLKGGRKTLKKSGARPVVVFGKLGGGTYTLEYNMTIGSGATQVTTRTTTVTVKIPGGIQSTRPGSSGTTRRRVRRYSNLQED
jgi:hypothetical protein